MSTVPTATEARNPTRAVVVMPTYNERENLPGLVPAILAASPELDLLIVDDNSPDGTGKLADELALQNPERVRVLHRAKKQGLGPAYHEGFGVALSQGYGRILSMDADFSHDPSVLPKLLEAVRDHDVAIGSRYVPGGGTVNWSLARRVLSRGGSFYGRLVLGVDIRDLTGAFRCYRREVLEKIDTGSLLSTGNTFLIEMLFRVARAGYRVKEIPITFVDRRAGLSKMSAGVIGEALWRVWQVRFAGASRKPPARTTP